MSKPDLTYKGRYTKEISFPLGGIGAGCLGLGGDGRFKEWEIMSVANKGFVNGFSSIAVKVEDSESVLGARFLQGDYQPPYTGTLLTENAYKGFGFGPDRSSLAGMPHFEECTFTGEYPFATLDFADKGFPFKVRMNAFSPFIPSNDKDSSLPAAFFEIETENTLPKDVEFTVAFNLANIAQGYDSDNLNNSATNELPFYHRHLVLGAYNLLEVGNGCDENSTDFGSMCVMTDCDDVSFQERWYRGEWFDNLEMFWHDFTAKGKLKNRSYDTEKTGDVSTIAAHVKLSSGQKKKVKFVLSWYYPNCKYDWEQNWDIQKKYYASLFTDSKEVARYCMSKFDQLSSDSRMFTDAVLNSDMPAAAIEAVLANVSILKTPTCLRLADGSFYGFEGLFCRGGCCPGSCTHVWNYAYALPFLFPNLERSMRDLDFKYNIREDGSMNFRLRLPLTEPVRDFRACADGQFGGIIKAYRDWKICGDDKWLRKNWDAMKKNIAFAWSPQNADKWDPDKTGVLYGRQHHTLDMELFGPNSWLSGFYVAALFAASEIAQHFGETQLSKEYREIAEKGRKWINENLFNGEYFAQKVDLTDKGELEQYAEKDSDVLRRYWNDETGEIKYQVGNGCIIDQVLAQWHCNIISLERVFDKDKTVSALKSIYKYNYKENMRNTANVCRLYSLSDEGGTIICTFPKGRQTVPITYSDETMYGFEYQVAGHMISEGLVDEGIKIVETIRARFDGERRNPWNEYECGSNYARSMASYALLNIFSGFTFDMTKKYIGFNPVVKKDKSSFFFSIEGGFGKVKISKGAVSLEMLYGEIALKSFGLPVGFNGVTAAINENECVFESKENKIVFDKDLTLKRGDILTVRA